jgi:hypothetical protein
LSRPSAAWGCSCCQLGRSPGYSPIVMNTQAELRLAFREYEPGTFVKHPRR